jgi:hypothetical protein
LQFLAQGRANVLNFPIHTIAVDEWDKPCPAFVQVLRQWRPISAFTLLSCPEADWWSAGKTGKVSAQSHKFLSFTCALSEMLAQFAEETSALI